MDEFIIRTIERACAAAENPAGMSIHDGMARVPSCYLRRLLAELAEARREAEEWMHKTGAAYAERDEARRDAERYRWLRNNAKEELLYPARAVGDMPDLRTAWALPVLICSGPVGGFLTFDEAIDIKLEATRAGGE